MITQQEIIRNLIDEADLSRAAFCERYQIKPRTLNAWLLPSESKGYRNAPRDILKVFEGELISYLDGSTISSKHNYPVGDTEGLVKVERESGPLYFPPIYLHECTFEVSEEHLQYMDQEIKDTIVDNIATVKHISLYPPEKPDQYLSIKSTVLNRAEPTQFGNYWIYLFHMNSSSNLEGAIRSYLYLMDDHWSLENFESILYGSEEFLMFFRPAPSYYPDPLIVYSSKVLHKLKFTNHIGFDFFEKCIDKNADEITLPRVPDNRA